jgi:glycosyltransferase involved in cell wall biosynthesis
MNNIVSLVIPVFNEQDCLQDLCVKINNLGNKFNLEIIFIDDGSTDDSPRLLRQLAAQDKRVKVISFRKNFGQTAAIAAGFDAASGEILVTLDADLQNDPADIPQLIKLINEGYDVVSGWRKNRKDNMLLRKIPSYFANRLISWVTGQKLHDYGCTLKAYRREIVKDIKLYGEMHRFLPALAGWVGGRIAEIPVKHHPRTRGRSKYNITRTMKVLIDLITVKFLLSYSTKPNYVFGGMGIMSLSVGFISLVVVAYRVVVLKRLEATPLVFIMTILFLAGIQLILMGLLAEMLIRTHFESQGKKIYFIKEKINI